MTLDDAALNHPAALQSHRWAMVASVFGLIGGPLAWFVQLDVGYALASWPCFPKDQRGLLPVAGFAWTWPTMIIGMSAAVAIALAALLVSWRRFRTTSPELSGVPGARLEAGTGRTRFLALWGILLGGTFALATLLTSVGFMVLPRCAG
jgi:hypothetical protein